VTAEIVLQLLLGFLSLVGFFAIVATALFLAGAVIAVALFSVGFCFRVGWNAANDVTVVRIR
jgi:hypothetical protein